MNLRASTRPSRLWTSLHPLEIFFTRLFVSFFHVCDKNVSYLFLLSLMQVNALFDVAVSQVVEQPYVDLIIRNLLVHH